MNISGESFDYGPWRWLPRWDPAFTAAYFDHGGLYSFGRQGEAIHWNCGQLAISLRLLAETEPLIFALDRFPALYQQALVRRFLWRLGVTPRGEEADIALVVAAEQHLLESGLSPDQFFFRHRAGRGMPAGPFGALLAAYEPAMRDEGAIWAAESAPTLVIDEVERIWSHIDADDDWSAFNEIVSAIREIGLTLGEQPLAAGHIRAV